MVEVGDSVLGIIINSPTIVYLTNNDNKRPPFKFAKKINLPSSPFFWPVKEMQHSEIVSRQDNFRDRQFLRTGD